MSGFTIRQQGPMGAVTASRTMPAGGTAPRRVALAGEGAPLSPDRRDSGGDRPQPDTGGEIPDTPWPPVDPATLLTASQLAPARAFGEAETALHLSRTGQDWSPPASSLSLRDRRV